MAGATGRYARARKYARPRVLRMARRARHDVVLVRPLRRARVDRGAQPPSRHLPLALSVLRWSLRGGTNHFIHTSMTPPPCPRPYRACASLALRKRSSRISVRRKSRSWVTSPAGTPFRYTRTSPADGSLMLMTPRPRSQFGRNSCTSASASTAVDVANSSAASTLWLRAPRRARLRVESSAGPGGGGGSGGGGGGTSVPGTGAPA